MGGGEEPGGGRNDHEGWKGGAGLSSPLRRTEHSPDASAGGRGGGSEAGAAEEAYVKSYGVQAGSASRAQIEAAIDDALRAAASAASAAGGRGGGNDGGRSRYCVGAAHDGGLAVAQGGRGTWRRLATIACSTASDGTFASSLAWGRHGKEEAAAIAYDCLARGVIRYGDIGFLSEGRHQLRGAERDALNTIQRLGGWYILGMSREQGIMLAPASAARDFVAPQSFYVGPLGAWTMSRLHSCRVSRPDYTEGGARPARREAGAAISPVAMLLYDAIPYRTRRHGTFSADREMCLLQLENAVEDAAVLGTLKRMGGRHKMHVAMDRLGRLYAAPADGSMEGRPAAAVEVDTDGMRVDGGDAEFAAAVREAARSAYDTMLPAYNGIKG